jgi:hypothetical protein
MKAPLTKGLLFVTSLTLVAAFAVRFRTMDQSVGVPKQPKMMTNTSSKQPIESTIKMYYLEKSGERKLWMSWYTKILPNGDKIVKDKEYGETELIYQRDTVYKAVRTPKQPPQPSAYITKDYPATGHSPAKKCLYTKAGKLIDCTETVILGNRRIVTTRDRKGDLLYENITAYNKWGQVVYESKRTGNPMGGYSITHYISPKLYKACMHTRQGLKTEWTAIDPIAVDGYGNYTQWRHHIIATDYPDNLNERDIMGEAQYAYSAE